MPISAAIDGRRRDVDAAASNSAADPEPKVLRRLLLLLHVASVLLFGGAAAVLLLIGQSARPDPPSAFAVLREAMTNCADLLLVPALLSLWVTGMLLVVARPALIDARWLRVKLGASVAMTALAFALLLPALHAATALALREATSVAMAPAFFAGTQLTLEQALARETWGLWLTLASALVALALVLWRPRLGGGPSPPDPGDR